MHPSPITLWQVILIFMLFVHSTGNKLKRLAFQQGCLIHKDVAHFDSLVFSKTFLNNFLLVFWLATITFMFPAIYLVLAD